MAAKHLFSIALVLSSAGASCFVGKQQANAQGDRGAADLVIRGRVLSETGELLPQKTGETLLASHRLYRIRVVRLISGSERKHTIVASNDADGTLVKNRDLIFHLARELDGIYTVQQIDRIR